MLTIEFKISNCITLKGKDIWGVRGSFGLFKSLNQAIVDLHHSLNELLFWKVDFKSFWPTGPRHAESFTPFQTYQLCARAATAVLPRVSSVRAAGLIIWGGWGGGVWGWGCAGLDKLHIIGWEHSKMATWAISSPPALIYHLYPRDDFVRIKRDLRVISWRKGTESCERKQSYCQTINCLSRITLTTL